MIRELQTGSTDAMEDAVAHYTPYLTAVVRRQLGDLSSPEDVEEIIADVFLTLWANRKRLVAGNLKSWLATVARNAALGRLRKKRHPQVPLEETIPATDESAEELLDARERDCILRNALESLSETDQEIFHRFYYFNQSITEIAEITHLKISTVKSRLSRGREKLREELIKGGYPFEDSYQ